MKIRRLGIKLEEEWVGKMVLRIVTFGSSNCYAHSKYELGIMRMFGGFSAGVFQTSIIV